MTRRRMPDLPGEALRGLVVGAEATSLDEVRAIREEIDMRVRRLVAELGVERV